MENNLILFGIDEARGEIPETALRKVLTENIQNKTSINSDNQIEIDNINFDKVQRLGNPERARENNRPRPIVARFERFLDREQIRKAGITLNKLQRKYKIYEHFPREIEDTRKKLYPVARIYIDRGDKVNLVRDKLYVNHHLYDLTSNTLTNTRTGNREHQHVPYGQRHAYPEQPRRYGNNNYQNAPQWNGARPKQPPQYNNIPPRSLDFRPSHASGSINKIYNVPNFETPNKFIIPEDQTPKRKAVSPLELETAPKRTEAGSTSDGEAMDQLDQACVSIDTDHCSLKPAHPVPVIPISSAVSNSVNSDQACVPIDTGNCSMEPALQPVPVIPITSVVSNSVNSEQACVSIDTGNNYCSVEPAQPVPVIPISSAVATSVNSAYVHPGAPHTVDPVIIT